MLRRKAYNQIAEQLQKIMITNGYLKCGEAALVPVLKFQGGMSLNTSYFSVFK